MSVMQLFGQHKSTTTPIFWRLNSGTPPPQKGGFVALIAGADAPLINFSLPAQLRGAARMEVLLRQVADRLSLPAREVEARPVKLTQTDERWTRSAVADRAQVAGWYQALGSAKARCQAIMPDYLALPCAEGLWVIAREGDQIMARLGLRDGFSAETDLAALLLEQARARAAPRWILIKSALPDVVIAQLDGLQQTENHEDLPKSLVPAVMSNGELSVNFAVDPNADSRRSTARLKAVLSALVLLIAGSVAWSAAIGLETRRDLAQATEIRENTRAAIVRDILDDAPVINLRVQVARAIAARRALADADGTVLAPLQILRNVAEEIVAHAASPSAVTLGPAPGVIAVDLHLQNLKVLDQLVAGLRQRGLHVRILRTTSDRDGDTEARLVFDGGGQ